VKQHMQWAAEDRVLPDYFGQEEARTERPTCPMSRKSERAPGVMPP